MTTNKLKYDKKKIKNLTVSGCLFTLVGCLLGLLAYFNLDLNLSLNTTDIANSSMAIAILWLVAAVLAMALVLVGSLLLGMVLTMLIMGQQKKK